MNFFLICLHHHFLCRSFVPPARDEESETQRKAHAKRVRETRRSTQGVTLEEIKSAEELVKKKILNNNNNSSSNNNNNNNSNNNVSTCRPFKCYFWFICGAEWGTPKTKNVCVLFFCIIGINETISINYFRTNLSTIAFDTNISFHIESDLFSFCVVFADHPPPPLRWGHLINSFH